MPYRGDVFTRGQIYHLYNRGAGRSQIFFNDANYQCLLRLLKQNCEKRGVTVLAYCLMPNHYNFLLRQDTDESLSKFMQVIFNAYSQSLNLQQGRTGALFEGRFKHKCVDQWAYLMVLSRYIHLNPVKAGLVARPEDWVYSNYREWIGLRAGTLVDKDFVRDNFSTTKDYAQFVNDVEGEKKSSEEIGMYLFD